MLGSIQIGTVLGIRVRVHWLFAVLVVVLVWMAALSGTSPLLMLTWIAGLFGLVFLHELGHCLMARRFGIGVLDITFWPLGGMARMTEIPEDARVEGLIAVAGPAVNLALAFLAAPIWFWSTLAAQAGGTAFVQGLALVSQGFILTNLLLGVFNLIPAFPMDGGRMLRAWLGRRGDWVAATATAVRVGHWFALAMIAAGLLLSLRGTNMLPLVGLFVWISGARELAVVRARHAAFPDPLAAMGLRPERRPEPAVRFADGAEPADVTGGAWGSRHAGAHDPRTRPTDPSGARRPETPWQTRPRSGRLSAEELERLERHPGPLFGAEPD